MEKNKYKAYPPPSIFLQPLGFPETIFYDINGLVVPDCVNCSFPSLNYTGEHTIPIVMSDRDITHPSHQNYPISATYTSNIISDTDERTYHKDSSMFREKKYMRESCIGVVVNITNGSK
jgi:hypothetical protein